MNRALRRHPSATKPPKRGGGVTMPRAPRAAATKGKTGILSWRPRWVMDIISELRKVVWPSRPDTMHLTVVVLIVSVVVGAFLGGVDLGFAWLVEHVLLR
jgi:preprotein translocase subunit SecE